MSYKTSKNILSDMSEVAEPKKPYSAPQLVYFGTVRELSGAGAGSKSENMPGQGSTMRKL